MSCLALLDHQNKHELCSGDGCFSAGFSSHTSLALVARAVFSGFHPAKFTRLLLAQKISHHRLMEIWMVLLVIAALGVAVNDTRVRW